MKTKIIINPIAGRKKQKNIESMIHLNLDKQRFKYDICFTTHRSHAKEITRESLKENYEVIIAVGGDGTVNEISSELIGTNAALGIIPVGSGNGFAFHFQISTKIKNAILQLNKSTTKLVDSCKANQLPFVNVSGIGFDAHIANLFSNSKKRGFANYLKLIFKELNYQAKDYIIKYEDKRREINALLISFANASQYGNNFIISPDSKVNDGKIDFVIIKNMPRWKILGFLIKISKGKINNSKFVEIIRSKKMSIISNEKIIHLDGEPKKINRELKIEINPKSLNILIPNE